MEVLKFKTTIKCSGCVANVSPHLNEAVGEQNWKVDITDPDKILTVETKDASAEDIVKAVEKAGYRAVKSSEQ